VSRHVLVTGASRGIGAATASWFVARGDLVSALSRSGDAPEGCASAHQVDVSDSAAVNEAVKDAVGRHGPITAAVVNAGITEDGLAVRMSDDQWRRVISVDLDGAFFCARAALGSMIRQRAGSLIFVSSISPFIGVPGQANYAAAKSGLVGLARSLAKEVASRSVTVNVVAPGFIDTDMTKALGDAVSAYTSLIPLGRIGEGADIAGVIGFLASDEARYLTGTVIPVDGGLGMGL
jgi:3-oxoacyl-[acyl-carrier protein] reductase